MSELLSFSVKRSTPTAKCRAARYFKLTNFTEPFINCCQFMLNNYYIPFWATVKTNTRRCCGRPDALSPEAAIVNRPRAIVHQVVHSTEGAIVFIVAQKRFVIVVVLPNPGGRGGIVSSLLYIGSYLTWLAVAAVFPNSMREELLFL